MLAISAAMVIALIPAQVRAEGVIAGTTVTNVATVDYRIGGVDQTEALAANSFTVDRRTTIFTVPDPASTVTVSRGQNRAWQAFDICNSANAPLDLGFSVA